MRYLFTLLGMVLFSFSLGQTLKEFKSLDRADFDSEIIWNNGRIIQFMTFDENRQTELESTIISQYSRALVDYRKRKAKKRFYMESIFYDYPKYEHKGAESRDIDTYRLDSGEYGVSDRYYSNYLIISVAMGGYEKEGGSGILEMKLMNATTGHIVILTSDPKRYKENDGVDIVYGQYADKVFSEVIQYNEYGSKQNVEPETEVRLISKTVKDYNNNIYVLVPDLDYWLYSKIPQRIYNQNGLIEIVYPWSKKDK